MLDWIPINRYKILCDDGEAVLTDAGMGFLDIRGGMETWTASDIHGNPIYVNDKYSAGFTREPTLFTHLREARKALKESY